MKLENLCNLLYYTFYVQQNNYVLKVNPFNNIKISDIKAEQNMIEDNIYSNLKFLYKDKYLNKYYYIKKINNIKCLVEITPIEDFTQINSNSVLSEHNHNRLISYMLANNNIVNSLLPIYNYDVMNEKINVHEVKDYENFRINIYECYGTCKPLNMFLKKHLKNLSNEDITYIITQILYYLVIVQNYYNNFYHKYFNLKSVKIFKLKKELEIKYTYGNKIINFKTIYLVKISDYDFCDLTENIINSTNLTYKDNIENKNDINVFLYGLYKFIKKTNNKNSFLYTLIDSLVSENSLKQNINIDNLLNQNKYIKQYIYNKMDSITGGFDDYYSLSDSIRGGEIENINEQIPEYLKSSLFGSSDNEDSEPEDFDIDSSNQNLMKQATEKGLIPENEVVSESSNNSSDDINKFLSDINNKINKNQAIKSTKTENKNINDDDDEDDDDNDDDNDDDEDDDDNDNYNSVNNSKNNSNKQNNKNNVMKDLIENVKFSGGVENYEDLVESEEFTDDFDEFTEDSDELSEDSDEFSDDYNNNNFYGGNPLNNDETLIDLIDSEQDETIFLDSDDDIKLNFI